MQIDTRQFHQAFFEEAFEHLVTMETSLITLESSPGDTETINQLFRCAHSIKGSSATFGFADVASFTHVLESLMDCVREGKVPVTLEVVEALLIATDALGVLIRAAQAGESDGLEPFRALIDRLNQLQQKSGTASVLIPAISKPVIATGPVEFEITVTPSLTIFQRGVDPLLLIRELESLGELTRCEIDTSRAPALAEMDPTLCYLIWHLTLKTTRKREAIDEVFIFVDDCCEVSVRPKELSPVPPSELAPEAVPMESELDATIASSLTGTSNNKMAASGNSDASTIRVPVEKIDVLMNLVGELVIAQAMVTQSVSRLAGGCTPLLQEALSTVERTTRDLQQHVMAVRLVPIATVFRRLPRVTRDLAGQLGKQLELVLEGEETELDKVVVDQLADPLIHLIRNSVDHGLETPAEREATGKPAQGLIKLSARHEGGNVVVDITDDGRGLNVERIRAKAIERGLVQEHERLTQEQIYALIFEPGFSTAAAVTDVSGRGVGMDVVKRNIQALNGNVRISSIQGQGTTVTISLPLTMAILEGLSVSVGGEIYILPLLSVVESLRPEERDLHLVPGRGEIVLVRGEALPLIRLNRLLGGYGFSEAPDTQLVVIVESHGRRYAFMVDELCGQLQVVMKSLEQNFRRVDGLSGATILGDGRVACILDIPGITRLAG